jgi:hypothetical protein
MKVIIPTDWSEIKLKQFVEIGKVPELGFDELDAQLKILEILTGVSDEYFLSIPAPELKKIISKTSFVFKPFEGKGIVNVIKVNGQRYKIRYETNELTGGEYIDVQNYLKEGVNKNLHKILAIYFHPVNMFGFKQRKYYKKVEGRLVQTLESRERTAEILYEHITMDKVFPVSTFFLKLWGGLIRATQIYLERKLKRIERDLKKEVRGL